MRILHVYKDYPPVVGGIENHVRLVAEAQAAQGHEVTVLVAGRRWRSAVEVCSGVRVIRAARLGTLASTPISLALPIWLRRERPDVTHLHFPYPLGEAAHYLLGRSRATVITYHSDVVRQKLLLALYRPLMMRVLYAADRIVISSPHYLATSEVLAPLEGMCRVVPLGINRQPFEHPDPERVQDVRRAHGPGPVLLFVGVLRYYKGLDYLIRAMPRVPGQLVVVGEGPMGAGWRRLVEDLALTKRVHFAGRVSDEELPAYYGAADVFVLPAAERSEAYGLVQIEAMAAGLPVICTELGTGTSYVNRHGESGLVVPPRSTEALAEAIGILLGDDVLRKRLAAGARARSEQFDATHMLRRLQAVYDELQ